MDTPRLITIALLTCVFTGSAQSVVETVTVDDPESQMLETVIDNTQLLYFGEGEVSDSSSYRSLLNKFYEDQFRHAQDPRAPYFLLMSRNGSLAMGIGGELKMIGAYDWHGSMPGAAFVPYDIPMTPDPATNDQLLMTPSRTAIFMSVFGNTKRFGQFQIYIHGKFNGDDHTFKLDRAYVTLGDWTVGLAKSTFDDPVAQPSTIDIEGPNSEIDDGRVLARYMHDLSKKFSVALSVEGSSANIPTSATYKPISSRVPDVGAFVQYAYGKQHVRLSGILRNMGYRDLVAGKNHNETGWGVNLSAKLRPVSPLTIFAAVNTGYGISNFVNDLSYGDLDLIGYASDPGKMYAPQSYGWYGALQYHYLPNVFSTIIVSQERLLPKSDSQYPDDGYKYGLYGTANVFWNVAPRVQVGAEFNVGKRVNVDHSSRTSYRAALMAEFSF